LTKRSEAVWQEVQHLASAFKALINAYQRSLAPHAVEAVPSLQAGLAPHLAAIRRAFGGAFSAMSPDLWGQGASYLANMFVHEYEHQLGNGEFEAYNSAYYWTGIAVGSPYEDWYWFTYHP
jgi:hypothetical protein